MTPLLAVLVVVAGVELIWIVWSVAHQSWEAVWAGIRSKALSDILVGFFLVLCLAYGAYIAVSNQTLERNWRLRELRKAAAERESWLASGGRLPAWEAYQDDLVCSAEEAFFLEWGGLLAAVEPSASGAGYTWYVDLWALPVGVRSVPTLHSGFSRSEHSAKRAALRWLVVELRRPVEGLDGVEAVAQ